MTTLIERAAVYLRFKDGVFYTHDKVRAWLDKRSPEVCGLEAAHQMDCANSVITDELEAMKPRFVLQDWVGCLTTRQQGVLILALRGPDGSPKESAAKPLVRTLRAIVMVSGRERKPMDFDTVWRDDTFMNTVHISADGSWQAVIRSFFSEMDAFNLHYFQHLIHAFAVVGATCPHNAVRDRCWWFYVRACEKLHVHPEEPRELLYRLRDGVREEDTLG